MTTPKRRILSFVFNVYESKNWLKNGWIKLTPTFLKKNKQFNYIELKERMMSGKIVLKTTDSTHLHSLCPIKNKNYKYMPCKTSWISGHPKVKSHIQNREK